MLKSGLVIEDSDENTYWIATKNDELVSKIRRNYKEGVVQIFGEIIPIQKGYNYGQTKPTIRIFDIRVNGLSTPYDMVPDDFREIWTPIVYDGNLELEEKEVVIYEDHEKGILKTKIDYILPNFIKVIAEEKERVSGRKQHWAEGVVIRPYIDRNSKDGTPLRLKVISKNYKESGEELS